MSVAVLEALAAAAGADVVASYTGEVEALRPAEGGARRRRRARCAGLRRRRRLCHVFRPYRIGDGGRLHARGVTMAAPLPKSSWNRDRFYRIGVPRKGFSDLRKTMDEPL